MGKYRDDPDAVSLRTTPDDAGPAYSDDYADDGLPEFSVSAPPPPAYEDGGVDDDDDEEEGHDPAAPLFSQGQGSVEDDSARSVTFVLGTSRPETHIVSTSRWIGAERSTIANEVHSLQNARVDNDAELLKKYIGFMAVRTPAPYIHVIGSHKETRTDRDGKKTQEHVTDFRILISLQNYLWPDFKPHGPNDMKIVTAENSEQTYRGTIMKKRASGAKGGIEVGDTKPTLAEWCHRYCASPAKTRVFRFDRVVTGLDEQLIRNRLQGIIRGTNYKGHISIEFPVADRAVEVYTTTWINNWRLTTSICWVFYLTFLWIFAWPVLLLTTKRYRVVRAEWPFSKTDAHGNKTYTTVSEEQWVDKYGPAVRQLCLDRYEGLAGDTLLNQVLARPETGQPVAAEFRVGDAQAAVGAAANAFHGGPTNTARQASNLLRFVGGSNDRVGWGFDT